MQSHWADPVQNANTSRVRRLVAGAVVAVVSSVAAMVVTAQPAYAAGIPGSIHNYDSGLCLQPVPPAGGSIYDNGIPIWQVPCNGSAEQNWKKILPEKPKSGDCSVYWFLGLPIGFSCGFDQKYYQFFLVNQKTLSCIDVTDARSDNGTAIQTVAMQRR
jgi:Ricin-type beta-trefoil lectin domain-like